MQLMKNAVFTFCLCLACMQVKAYTNVTVRDHSPAEVFRVEAVLMITSQGEFSPGETCRKSRERALALLSMLGGLWPKATSDLLVAMQSGQQTFEEVLLLGRQVSLKHLEQPSC